MSETLDVIPYNQDIPILDVILSNQDIIPLGVSISDFTAFTTTTYVDESIAEHNVSPVSHLDIRALITNLETYTTSALSSSNYELSAYINEVSGNITNSLIITANALSNSISSLTTSSQYLIDNKIDKPGSAVSGNIAIFNSNKNVIDSGINSSRVVLLDSNGLVPQDQIPEVYIKNIDNVHYHLVAIQTDEYGDHKLLIGAGVIL